MLQDMSEAWITSCLRSRQEEGTVAAEADDGSDGDVHAAADGIEATGYTKGQQTMPLPSNYALAELFHKKNWKHKTWLIMS